uniref:DMT family transporter n=1 Tax=candidate division WOR-3 bacterium TaxID=2052148 RepID=A0A7C3N6J7_UNCW3
MKEKKIGLIYAFIALFLWGIHGVAGRYLAIENVNMLFVAAVRFFIGTSLFFIFLFFKKNLTFNFKEKFKLVLAISIIGITGNSLLYHISLKYLSGTLVMIFENLSPIFVILFSFLVDKEKPTLFEIIAFLLSFLGIIIIVLGKEHFLDLKENFYLGIFWGILTGMSFGFYVYLSSKLVSPLRNKPDRIINFLFKIFLISSITVSPIIFFSSNKPTKLQHWFWILEMGIFQSGLAYIFWNYALSYLPVNSTSILFIFTILFTTINEIIFLKLKLNIFLIIGGGLIILSGYLISKNLKNSEGKR